MNKESIICTFPIEILPDKTVRIKININVYSQKAITAVAYKFTDRCYIFIDKKNNETFHVHFQKQKNISLSLYEIAQLFCNELIDQQIRVDLEKEMKNTREMILEASFHQFKKGK